ncbi:MAG: hypothetical protein ACYDHH_24610 [Solirubrobacteraceae bacterium]
MLANDAHSSSLRPGPLLAFVTYTSKVAGPDGVRVGMSTARAERLTQVFKDVVPRGMVQCADGFFVGQPVSAPAKSGRPRTRSSA